MDDRGSSRQMIGTLIFLIIGPALWAANLTVIYGAQSSLCAFSALPPPSIGLVVAGASLFLTLLAVCCLVWPLPVFAWLTGSAPPKSQWPFLRGTTRALGALSVLAMIYFTAAVAFLPACDGLR